jgi:SAM-dependent methyltransferase
MVPVFHTYPGEVHMDSRRSNPTDDHGVEQLKMYAQLAEWWPLLSAPEDYAEEAAFIRGLLKAAVVGPLRTLLEIGSGGGNNASFLKRDFQLTLVDLSTDMLRISQQLNPEVEHRQGDMRRLDLGRTFDAVLIHDAIMYMTTQEDLQAAIQTAFRHCRPGGAAVFVPDWVQETFAAETSHGGHDGDRRSLRYLEWSHDPDPEDQTFVTDYVYLLRSEENGLQVLQEQHTEGLFPRQLWLDLISAAGFEAQVLPDNFNREVFLGKVPATVG